MYSYKLKDYIFCYESRKIKDSDSNEQVLEPLSAELLLFFIQNNGRVISRDELMKTIWKGAIVEDASIGRAITKLRKALRDDAKSPQFIETITKKGYRWIFDAIEHDSSNGVVESSIHTNNPSVAKYGIIVILAIILSVSLLFIFILNSKDPLVNVNVSELIAIQGQEHSPQLSGNGENLYFIHENSINSIQRILHKNLSTGETSQILSPTFGELRVAKLSPDSQQLAYIETNNNQCIISLFDLPSQTNKSLIGCQQEMTPDLAWSNDGKRLFFIASVAGINMSSAVFELDIQTLITKRLTDIATVPTAYFSVVTLDDESLLMGHVWQWPKTEILKYNLSNGHSQSLLQKDFMLGDFAYRSDNIYYYHSEQKELKSFNINTQLEQRVYQSTRYFDSITSSHDNSKIMLSETQANIDIILMQPMNVSALDSNQTHSAILNDENIETLPEWRPFTKEFVYLSDSSGHLEFWTMNVSTKEKKIISSFTGEIDHWQSRTEYYQFSWSDDGMKLLYDSPDGNISILDLTTNKVEHLVLSNSMVRNPTWSKDHESIIYVANTAGQVDLFKYSLSSKTSQRLTYSGALKGFNISYFGTLGYAYIKPNVTGLWFIPDEAEDTSPLPAERLILEDIESKYWSTLKVVNNWLFITTELTQSKMDYLKVDLNNPAVWQKEQLNTPRNLINWSIEPKTQQILISFIKTDDRKLLSLSFDE